MSDPSYDFVIVGGGSAGCALANRLTADPSIRVLVLEAGRPDHVWDVFTRMPAAMGFAIGSKHHNWKFTSEPEPFLHNRTLPHPRGKLLGGSSSINAMNYQRGHPADFDRWAIQTGRQNWDYAHCLPYFKRLETSLAHGDSEFRGSDGPQILERAPADHPLFHAFFSAAQQAGYSMTPDINGARQEGFAAFERMISRGRRFSAARAYLHPVKSRRNLTVRCRVLVTKIDFEGTRAVGVTYRASSGTEHEARSAEVILCGGAFNSPQLLQLSGVGHADELEALDVAPVHHLPGVGENLEDHLAVQLQHACTQPISMLGNGSKLEWPKIGLQWLLGRRGDGATNLFEGGGFIRSSEAAPYPDVMVVFAPFARQFDPDKQVDGPGYLMCVDTLVAEGRGTVKIASTDPSVHPRIQFNYLSTERDRRDWATALRIGRAILDQPAFREFDGGEVVPGRDVESDDELVDWVARTGQTGLHPTSTCRMGYNETAVVDPADMRVHGVDGLRVVDASVFPSCTNASTYAPVMMVAEKSADVILGNTPLPPEYPSRQSSSTSGASGSRSHLDRG